MKLSIIIVSWKVKELLRECLISVYKETQGIESELFVVDNDSQDGTVEMINSEFPQVNLIANNQNSGFAKANNQAIKLATGEYILLLNPDMKLKDNALGKIVGWMDENKQASVAGCHLVTKRGDTIKHVRQFPKFIDQLAIVLKLPHIFPSILDDYLRVNFDYTKSRKVDSIRGGFFMLRRTDFEEILPKERFENLEILDERFFIWFEEVDFCKTCAESGKEVWYTPVAECIDYVGQSFNQVGSLRSQRYFRNSMLKYFKKWHSMCSYVILKLVWLPMIVFAFVADKLNLKNKTHKT